MFPQSSGSVPPAEIQSFQGHHVQLDLRPLYPSDQPSRDTSVFATGAI